jgi:hypothetical protein
LHILSISVFVEFVCLLVQLLLVTCVSSNPSRHAHRHAAASRFPSPVPWCGRSKKEKKKKKRKAIQKKEQKKERESERKERPPHSPSGKREPLRCKSFASSQFATDSSLLKEFSVESGSVFATAYRTSPTILHGKTTTPQHTIFSACGELLFEILCVHIISFWGTLKKK